MTDSCRIALRLLLGLMAACAIHSSWAAEDLTRSESGFKGTIGFSAQESTPDWPKPVKAPREAPNVVVILLDDIGFADVSTFGGLAHTPELDKLAAQGLRYNNFNTTGMCSPTRAALLSGRNHHRVGFGSIADFPGGYPGYHAVWKKSTVSIAEVLRQHGYSTSAFGKWHNTPDWEINPTGPFDRWPTGLGFEYFYGFMGPAGLENHWEPSKLYRNTAPVDPPATSAQGYHFTTDMTNEAIRWIQTHESLAAEKPYFLYFAPGAVHFPHHAPKEWIEPYRGKFDQGWDRLNREILSRQKHLGVIPVNAKLTPRPKAIPAWASLSADQKKLYARQMEVYAGFIAHTDDEVGRLLKAVRSGPAADNTLILYIVGDNGSAGGLWLDGVTSGATTVQEQLRYRDELGGPHVPVNHYSSGWAWAGNTPFQYWKSIASHFGGVRAPLVVSWPARIKNPGGVRNQFTHVNDVAATLYEVAAISFPSSVNGVEQQPLDGVSFTQTFESATAPSTHHTQYFEMSGNRAIYHDGWIAAARHQSAQGWLPVKDADYTQDRWELYHVAEDFSQALDIAAKYPGKLNELQALFDTEARKNDVYPLGGARSVGKPSLTDGKRELIYYPGTRYPTATLPKFAQSSYRMTADILIPEDGAEGVIVSYGSRGDGFVWYVKAGHLVYESWASEHHRILTSQTRLPRGRMSLAFAFERSEADKNTRNKKGWEGSSGTGRLYINGQMAAEAALPQVFYGWDKAMFIGRAAGSPMSTAFSQLFAFTGTLEKVTVETK